VFTNKERLGLEAFRDGHRRDVLYGKVGRVAFKHEVMEARVWPLVRTGSGPVATESKSEGAQRRAYVATMTLGIEDGVNVGHGALVHYLLKGAIIIFY